MNHDILNITDVRKLVDTFYDKVRANELLSPIFEERIQNRWPEHLEKMYRFWQTILLEEHTYNGSPFAPHAQLPVNKEHFNDWLNLFNQTIDELFVGKKADEAKWRAGKMAEMFHFKIQYFKNSSTTPIL